MIEGLLRGAGIAFIIFGVYQALTGQVAVAAIYLICGCIMDLQASGMSTERRLLALEKIKENKDGSQSKKSS